MTGRNGCDEVRELLPELALGILDGEERANVLEHAAGCADCRRELEGLSSITDELLELAPPVEPPAGFELRVLGSVAPRPRRPRRLVWRPLAVAAVALAASAVTAGVMLQAFRDDRSLAGHYRSVLAEAHGSYFGAVRLRDQAGAEGGVVFLYRGSPSWLVITAQPPYSARVRRDVVTTDGRTVPLEWFGLSGGTWGGAAPVDLATISSRRLLGDRGRILLEAEPGAAGSG